MRLLGVQFEIAQIFETELFFSVIQHIYLF